MANTKTNYDSIMEKKEIVARLFVDEDRLGRFINPFTGDKFWHKEDAGKSILEWFDQPYEEPYKE